MQSTLLNSIIDTLESAKAESVKVGAQFKNAAQNCASQVPLQEIRESVPNAEGMDQTNLLFEITKNENRDLKARLEKILVQVRNRDQQISTLHSAVETMKTPQKCPQSSSNSEKLEQYFAEYDACIELRHKLGRQEQTKTAIDDVAQACRMNTSKVNYLSCQNELLQTEKSNWIAKEHHLIEELAQRKAILLNLGAKVACLQEGQAMHLDTVRSLLEEKDSYRDALEKERAVNDQLMTALGAAERDSGIVTQTVHENALYFDRALKSQEKVIDELRQSLVSEQQQQRRQQQQAMGSADSTGAAVTDKDKGRRRRSSSPDPAWRAERGGNNEVVGVSRVEKRTREDNPQPMGLNAPHVPSASTPHQAEPIAKRALMLNQLRIENTAGHANLEAFQLPPCAPAQVPSGSCSVCAEVPFGLMTRCSACEAVFHSSCARRSGGCKETSGMFRCKKCEDATHK